MISSQPLSSRYFRGHRRPLAVLIGFATALLAVVLNGLPTLGVTATAGLAQTELRLLQNRLDAQPVLPDPDIVLITIEPDTPARLKLNSDTTIVPRRIHAQLTEALRDAGASVVFFDLLFHERRDPKGDAAFRSALARSGPLSVVLAMAFDPDKSRPDLESPSGWRYWFLQPVVLPARSESRVVAASAVSWDSNKVAEGVVLLRPDEATGKPVPHVTLAVVMAERGISQNALRWDDSKKRLQAGPYSWDCGYDREFITRFATPRFPTIEYSRALELLSHPDTAAEFRNKIVIVGDFTGADMKPTRIGQMNGAEFNAHTINTLLQPPAKQIGTWTLGINLLWAWLLAFLASGFLSTMRWRTVVPGTLGIVAITLVAPQLALIWLRVHVYTLTPALAVVLSLLATALISSGMAEQLLPWHLRTGKSEGRIEEATVVFVDLRGSTPMVEKLGAKRAGKAHAHLLSRLSTVIRANGGDVERTLGDGLLAVFRESGKTPHAQRALTAVCAILAEVEQISPEWQSAFGVPAAVTIGVESGSVSGAIVTTGDSEEWSSSGLTVNISARLQAACGARGLDVLIGPGAQAAAAGAFDLEPVGQIELKGISEPAACYTLRESL